jgi:N-acetyltransferase 10
VLLLLDKMTDIDKLSRTTMCMHGRMRSERFGEATSRFMARFLRSLRSCENLVAIDSEFNVLRAFRAEPILRPGVYDTADLDEVKARVTSTGGIDPVVALVRTRDQAHVVLQVFALLDDMADGKLVTITATRRRGQSAALGLVLAYAVWRGYSNMFVTSPASGNVRSLFEFALRGLDALGYQEEFKYTICSEQCEGCNQGEQHARTASVDLLGSSLRVGETGAVRGPCCG